MVGVCQWRVNKSIGELIILIVELTRNKLRRPYVGRLCVEEAVLQS